MVGGGRLNARLGTTADQSTSIMEPTVIPRKAKWLEYYPHHKKETRPEDFGGHPTWRPMTGYGQQTCAGRIRS